MMQFAIKVSIPPRLLMLLVMVSSVVLILS